MTAIRPMQAQPVAVTMERAHSAMGEATPAVGNRHILAYAPPMPEGFWGTVEFEFKAGKVVMAAVREMVKP